MHCPRCGTPNEPGDRFCSACGTSLRAAPTAATEGRSLRERIERLVGTTPRARLLSVGTALAIMVAVAAFIALKPSNSDTIPRDAYTIAADGMCVNAKRQILAVERRSLSRAGQGDPSGFARALVPIVASWRSQFQELTVPVDRISKAQQLDTVLRDVEIQIAQLALIAAHGNRSQTVARAKQVDTVTTRVEKAISALGLTQCARDIIGLSRPPS